MKRVFLSLLLTCAIMISATPQEVKPGKIGIGIDGVSSPNIAAKCFITPQIAGEIIAGLNIYSPGGDTPLLKTKVTGTDFRVGAAGLYHFYLGEFTPYVGLEAAFQTKKQGGFFTVEEDAKNIVSTNIILGGEYFIAKRFSLGIKEKIGMDFYLKRDVPKEENDFYMNTGTLVTARFYFN